MPNLPAGQLFGKTLQRYEVAGLWLMETVYPPGLKVPKHSHELAGFCFVLRGTFERVTARGTSLCKPSTLSFHPPGDVHSERFGEVGARLFSFQVGREWLGRVREHAATLGGLACFSNSLLSQLMMRLFTEIKRGEALSPLVVEGLALEIIAEAARHSAPEGGEDKAPPWLRQVQELLHARFSERLSFAEIAEAVGVHPVHLARTFRRHYRCTIGEYVRRLRIEFACQYLLASDASLTEIALRAGFSSHSHFSTLFKRHVGLTPAEYRAISRAR